MLGLGLGKDGGWGGPEKCRFYLSSPLWWLETNWSQSLSSVVQVHTSQELAQRLIHTNEN